MTRKKANKSGATKTTKAGKNVSGVKAGSKKSGKNWVIAVDPYSEFDVSSVRDLVAPLAETATANKLIAGYVLAPASLNWTGDFSGPWVKKFKPLAEQQLNELYASEKVTTTVIPCHHAGRRASVAALLNFAKKVKSELLVITTHARTGLDRLTMGSFAETVILSSKVPVLVVNPSHPIPHKIQRILVPTDLSKAGERYALDMADFAKRIGAEIILFYKQPDPLDPIVQQGVYSLGGGWVSLQNFIEQEMSEKTKQIEKLTAAVAKKGVIVSQMIDSSPDGLIEGINEAVKSRRADMVSVLTQSGSVSAALLGSVARGLVRTAQVPVFVKR